ncbi:HlyD family efflux transporter periplasmic adaptor subunit [Raineyella fluvialis]|uniref:HlyD family efflux transporter periplasmic adaptor subunit n=1 Tax=Raineyella fluvialis TaxID=2662261 RepID=A0A5Q2FA65_9ACTN|nr:HlyD family efflux transporter periplasmic adaptor subunit [Raineyella fluvialis]QGF23860.1 HlyD family efflux transporter periplasmic adaptor subunit [Raineyella fluvialis]
MTWPVRIKLWFGIIVVLALCLGLTLLFNHRQTQVASVSASVEAPTVTISSDYGGVVTDQLVQPGDRVTAGEVLFVASSPQVSQEAARGNTPKNTPIYTVDAAKSTIVYRSVTDGYVAGMQALKGTYIAGTTPMVVVVQEGRRQVAADFRLAPHDYGRIDNGAHVSIILPNNEKLDGQVENVDVTAGAADGSVPLTRVRVSSDQLSDARLGSLTRQGTPVTAILSLRDEGPLAGMNQSFLNFLTKIGLR